VTPRLAPPGAVHFEFRGISKKWGRPPKTHGLELRWALLPRPPERFEELVNMETATKSPVSLEFPQPARAKTIYYSARWENGAQRKGPWTDIAMAVVP